MRSVVVAILLTGCVSVQSYNNPSLPPGWHAFGGLELGYAIALPESWVAFDLTTQSDSAVTECSRYDGLRQDLMPRIADLANRGIRLFACDQSHRAQAGLPVAYAIGGQAPPEGLDAYLTKQEQAAGRELVDRRHLSGNAGDMVMQKVRERLTAADGTIVDTTQYQFLIIRFSALHVLLVELPTPLDGALGGTVLTMGASFTPVR